MARKRVLIIEDDPDIVELVQYNLEREGFDVVAAGDGESGLAQAKRVEPQLVLLDLMLPGIGGLDVCRSLKQNAATSLVPIIMLTAKSEESDVVLGLELGADDFIPKPFSPRELVARIRAVLRRFERESQAAESSRLVLDGVTLDATRHEVLVDGEPVTFTRAEFRLLWTLARRPGRVFTRNDLIDTITGGDAIILDRNVDVHVSAIRKKLGRHGDLIGTVRGVGYKLRDD
jgi:two-component system phosphate regulon response regulator PhoB